MDYTGLRAMVCDEHLTIRVRCLVFCVVGAYMWSMSNLLDAVTAVCKAAQFAGEPAYDLVFLVFRTAAFSRPKIFVGTFVSNLDSRFQKTCSY